LFIFEKKIAMTIIDQIRELAKQLTSEERDTVLAELKRQESALAVQLDALDSCPHCLSKAIIKHSKFKSRQRYKCKACSKTFTNLTGSPIHGLKKQSLWYEYYKSMMTDGYQSLVKMKEKFGISIQTAFDWRHKALLAMNQSGEKFEGITEIDDIWFLYSQKGRKGLKYSRKRGGSKRKGDNNYQVKMLATADRKGTFDMSVARIGRLKKSDIQRKIGNRIGRNTVLTSDKHKSISAFAKDSKMEHIAFDAKKHTAGNEHHVQYINNVASRFDTVVNRIMRGVSTKYLQNYSNWFVALEGLKKNMSKPEKAIQQLLKQNDAWDLFTNFERQYKDFIQTYSERTYRCPVKRTWKAQNWNSSKFQNIAII
jgi:transposase-like protein